jgi:hypothetical protein
MQNPHPAQPEARTCENLVFGLLAVPKGTGVAPSTAASVLVWKEKGLTQAALNDAVLSEQKARRQARQAAEIAKREAETAKEMSAFSSACFSPPTPSRSAVICSKSKAASVRPRRSSNCCATAPGRSAASSRRGRN